MLVLVEDANGKVLAYDEINYSPGLDYWRRLYNLPDVFHSAKQLPLQRPPVSSKKSRKVSQPTVVENFSILQNAQDSPVQARLKQQIFVSMTVNYLQQFFRGTSKKDVSSSSPPAIIAEFVPAANTVFMQEEPQIIINQEDTISPITSQNENHHSDSLSNDLASISPLKKPGFIILHRDHKLFEEKGVGVPCILPRNFRDNVDYGIYERERQPQY